MHINEIGDVGLPPEQMKMLLYLFCQLVDLIEAEQCQADPLTGGKQKGKKKVSSQGCGSALI